MAQAPRRRLSLFSFGSVSSNNLSNTSPPSQPQAGSGFLGDDAQPSTQQTSQQASSPADSPKVLSAFSPPPSSSARFGAPHSNLSSGLAKNLAVNTNTNTNASESDDQFYSPSTTSPTSADNELNIFERSVQDNCNCIDYSNPHSRRPTLTKLKSKSIVGSHGSSISLSNFKNEDYIPPALDATTSILNDSKTNLDDVDIIYASRRNSCLGLNMALGRPAPSRKNSVYSMTQLHQQQSPNLGSQQVAEGNKNNDSALRMSTSQSLNHPMSPASPPKLNSSKSSISFYSYADLLSNDEYTKRPPFKQSYSQGKIPSRKNSVSSNKLGSFSNPSSGKKFNRSLNKFLISPESSDSEDDVASRSKSINDNESLVSSSMGDFLRQTKTELSGSG